MPKPTFERSSFASAGFAPASFTAPKDDPLAGVEYTGDPEADSAAELSAAKAAFIERAKREAKRMEKATDSEYWFCVCFQTREEVKEFLRKASWGPSDAKYIDGHIVADKMGIQITKDTTSFGAVKIDSRLAALARR